MVRIAGTVHNVNCDAREKLAPRYLLPRSITGRMPWAKKPVKFSKNNESGENYE